MEKRAAEVDIRPHLLAIHHFAPRVYDPAVPPLLATKPFFTIRSINQEPVGCRSSAVLLKRDFAIADELETS